MKAQPRSRPRRFKVHFNRIAMQRKDPKVWSVRLSDRCLHGTMVRIRGAVDGVFHPERAQPRAFFEGVGWVKQIGTVIYINGAPEERDNV